MPPTTPLNFNIRTLVDLSGLRALQSGLGRVLGTMRSIGGVALANLNAERARVRGGFAGPAYDPHLAGLSGRPLDAAYSRRYYGEQSAAREYMRPSDAERPGWSFQQSQAYAYGQKAENVALKGSVESFLLGSADKYFQLSRAITQTGRRFREANGEAHRFGEGLGYTIEQTTQLVSTLGEQTNSVSRGQFARYTGFARDRGLDPGAALSALGQLQQLTGGFGDDFLANLVGRANARGMGQGRLQEYLQGLAQTGQQMFANTGSVRAGTLAAINDLPGLVFGATNPAGQGAMGQQFMGGLQGTLTGQGPMRSFMLRSMGFGKAGGPGYIEAMKRLEAGVYDPRNLQDLFGEFRERGLGEAAQFRALQSVSGGQLKAWQIEALVKKFGSDSGYAELQAATAQGAGRKYLDAAMASYSPEEQAIYKQEGYAGLGRAKGRISAGEQAEVEFEGMQMATGPQMAKSVLDIRDVVVNLAKAFEKFLGTDPLSALNKFTEAMVKVSAKIERMTPENVPAKVAQAVAEDPNRAVSAARLGAVPLVLLDAAGVNLVGGSSP